MKWHSSLVAFHGKSPRYFTTASAWPWHRMNPTMVLSSFGLNSFSSASAWIGDSSKSSFNSTHGFGRLRCSQQSESASCVLHKVLQLASCSSNWSASFRSCNAKCAAATEPSSRQAPWVMEANKESLAGNWPRPFKTYKKSRSIDTLENTWITAEKNRCQQNV